MNNLFNLIPVNHINTLIKIGFLIVDFAFIIFLMVVLKQVHTMNTIVNDSSDSYTIKSVALFLVVAAISLFLAALVIL